MLRASWWFAATAVGFAVVGVEVGRATAADDLAAVVKAHAFELLDGQGRVRGRWAANMLPNETPTLVLLREDGSKSISLREASQGGGGVLEFFDKQGHFRLAARTAEDGSSFLAVHDAAGRPSLILRTDKDGKAQVIGADLKVIWSAP